MDFKEFYLDQDKAINALKSGKLAKETQRARFEFGITISRLLADFERIKHVKFQNKGCKVMNLSGLNGRVVALATSYEVKIDAADLYCFDMKLGKIFVGKNTCLKGILFTKVENGFFKFVYGEPFLLKQYSVIKQAFDYVKQNSQKNSIIEESIEKSFDSSLNQDFEHYLDPSDYLIRPKDNFELNFEKKIELELIKYEEQARLLEIQNLELKSQIAVIKNKKENVIIENEQLKIQNTDYVVKIEELQGKMIYLTEKSKQLFDIENSLRRELQLEYEDKMIQERARNQIQTEQLMEEITQIKQSNQKYKIMLDEQKNQNRDLFKAKDKMMRIMDKKDIQFCKISRELTILQNQFDKRSEERYFQFQTINNLDSENQRNTEDNIRNRIDKNDNNMEKHLKKKFLPGQGKSGAIETFEKVQKFIQYKEDCLSRSTILSNIDQNSFNRDSRNDTQTLLNLGNTSLDFFKLNEVESILDSIIHIKNPFYHKNFQKNSEYQVSRILNKAIEVKKIFRKSSKVIEGAKDENDVIRMKNELLEQKIRLVESARLSHKSNNSIFSNPSNFFREKENYPSFTNFN